VLLREPAQIVVGVGRSRTGSADERIAETLVALRLAGTFRQP
jgi:hypothetical protein